MIYNSRLITYTRSGSAFLGYLINDKNICKVATGSHELNRLKDGELLLTCVRNPVDVIASSIINELEQITDFQDFCNGQIKGYITFHTRVLETKHKVVVNFDRLVSDTDAYIQEIAFHIGCEDYHMPDHAGVRMDHRGHLHSSKEHPFYLKALEIAKKQDYSVAMEIYQTLLKFSI